MPISDPDLPAVAPEILLSQVRPEIEKINDPELREIVIRVLVASPLWFWFIPAALGGKNHPPDECGVGGLVHHIKKVTFFTRYLLRLYGLRESPIADRAIAAAILHDCLKYGDEESTYAQAWATGRQWTKTHPITCAKHAEKYGAPPDIVLAIASHYGPFLETPLSNWKSDGPINLTHFLYLSDGLSSSPYNQQPFAAEELFGGVHSLQLDSLKERLLSLDDEVTHISLSPLAFHTLRDFNRKEIMSKRGLQIDCLPAHGHSLTRVLAGESTTEFGNTRLFSEAETRDSFIGSF